MENTITMTEAAKRLRVSRNTIGRWITRGILRAITLPTGGRRVVEASVEEVCAKMTGRSAMSCPSCGSMKTLNDASGVGECEACGYTREDWKAKDSD